MARLRVAFGVAVMSAMAAFMACGSEESAPLEVDDAEFAFDSGPRSDGSSTVSDGGNPNDGHVDVPDASTDDAAPIAYASCKAALAAVPGSPSGRYRIDIDGSGPLEPLSLFCDMTFEGGGWTLIYSTTNGLIISNPGSERSDAGSDAPYYLREPGPGELGALKPDYAKALARISTEIHIRSPFPAPTEAGDAGWITSVVPEDGGPSFAVANLRDGFVTNARSPDGWADKWTGPNATADRLAYVQTGGFCSPVNTEVYPQLYWACNNQQGLHIGLGSSRWKYTPIANEPLEAYLR